MKIWVRIGLQFYCRSIEFSVKQTDHLPTILACNHPNSFLDALIIGSRYNRPIHFLARGDVFKKPWVRYLLRKLQMIPIHRLSEGRSGMHDNEATFKECLVILERRGVILIFSEGLCKNEWMVQPLKKGTARLTYMALYQAHLEDLQLRPISLSYCSFTDVPVRVVVKEGQTLQLVYHTGENATDFYRHFNTELSNELQHNLVKKELIGSTQASLIKKLVLALPAFIGWLSHRWLYNFLKSFALKKTKNTVFFHSVLFALLLLTYPILLLIVTLIVLLVSGQPVSLLLLVVLPFFAWCYKEYYS